MRDILKSPAKIVFIVITLTACAGFFVAKLSEDNFMLLAVSCFSFFFSFKGTGNIEEHAGK